MRCTNQLASDHQVILHALNILREIGDRMERQEAVVSEDVGTLLQFLREFAHGCLDDKEEYILLPALKRAGMTEPNGMLRVIWARHREANHLMNQLEAAVASEDRESFIRVSRLYVERVADLIFDEDTDLFRLVDQTLRPEDDQWIVAEFNKVRTQLGAETIKRYDRLIRQLDARYTTPHCI